MLILLGVAFALLIGWGVSMMAIKFATLELGP